MGREVAQVLSQHGLRVILVDVSDEALRSAREAIEQKVRFRGLLGLGGPAVPVAEVLEGITFATDFKQFTEVDFVVENVTEDWEIKRQVFQEIDRLCPAHAVFAVNTSCIPITKVGSAVTRPDRVIGTHFMNPVTQKPVVEIIRGHHTSDPTVATTQRLLKAIGKEGIVVNDAPGFVSNRVLMLTINEAVFLLQEGVSTVEDIDAIFRTCFGHKMGPLETADLIGLDTILHSIDGLYESFADSKYRPCPLLQRMVHAGLHGRKSGRGFYDYGGRATA
ncbi:3-hydroxyacyl-CoA dehydrogenase family protein [Dactylosporangium fulvum]|uniref:3-hydroxyacyl-CoA dehydrogenase NAD-binding domain-containing protein n=2 Tax=Dactylosporangium fulvum TaxID=53359 RepID=A0ABY5W7R3_9ACTN|nr:3-hydroxyacyl-CoA dehydrogenase NAD-binding domain-containing protein [Dactylosporangium fulvum]UWP85400.1 3-hydroxyacyl-CoA dehydrogenase NAD-binding domain-containing protein [Dactylosporangium fulvum]